MCGKAPKPPPPVVQRDPVKEQVEAEAKAQREANAETANRRRRRSWSASLTQAALRSGNLGGGNNEPARTLLTQATPGG
jgi:type IV secretory pathway TrbL component